MEEIVRAIRDTPNLEERPDLILRLVEILFLLAEPKRELPS